jgi:hypothetical protein
MAQLFLLFFYPHDTVRHVKREREKGKKDTEKETVLTDNESLICSVYKICKLRVEGRNNMLTNTGEQKHLFINL